MTTWKKKIFHYKAKQVIFTGKMNVVFRHPRPVGLSHGRVKWKMCFFAWMHRGKIKQTLVAILSGFGLNLKGSFSPPINGEKRIKQPNLTITNFVFQQN